MLYAKITQTMGVEHTMFSFVDKQFNDTTSYLVLPYAHAKLTINNTDSVIFQYDNVTRRYKCNYVVQQGDRLSLNVKCYGFNESETEVVIPTKNEIEIIDYSKEYSKRPIIIDDDIVYDIFGSDTLIAIKLHIKDPENEKNFYRLSARAGCATDVSLFNSTSHYIVNDIFMSDDIIFYNSEITEPYNGWPANFFNVFDDSIINGQDYIFTIKIRKRDERYLSNYDNICHYVCIDFESITEDLYEYFLAERKYQISNKSVFGEVVYVPSNVRNGFGIFGAISGDRKVIKIK